MLKEKIKNNLGWLLLICLLMGLLVSGGMYYQGHPWVIDNIGSRILQELYMPSQAAAPTSLVEIMKKPSPQPDISARYETNTPTGLAVTISPLDVTATEKVYLPLLTQVSEKPPDDPVEPIAGPLRVMAENPRYFTDGNGEAILLVGSHTWLNLQDGGLTDPPGEFDYETYLDFLESQNHNFFRLWTWEQAKWVVEWGSPYYFQPMPFERTGPGAALDGKPKFDLSKLNQAYFDRMRERVIAAQERGIYVAIMLFNGWSVEYPKGSYNQSNQWMGHPFNQANNINGVNGDVNRNNSGEETHTLAVAEVVKVQEAYVKKVIDTVNDLDNVLYEISNESPGNSEGWQYYLINFIKAYEAGLPKQHPVGMTVEWPGGDNGDLYASPADWISPNGDIDNPIVGDGRKVIINDTDHLCGICGDRRFVWKSFTRGLNPIFMDQYDDGYKLHGGGYDINNPNDVSLRQNLGYVRAYAERIKLSRMAPRGELCSSRYCLANPEATGAEYLVYLPEGGEVGVDLTGTPGNVMVEWFDPESGSTMQGASVVGGRNVSFTSPFSQDAVLYLSQGNNP